MKPSLMGKIGASALLAFGAVALAQEPAGSVVGVYTLPAITIADAQNGGLPDSVANDRGLLLGGIGSDLWRSADMPEGEFWMITDRGPNGQIRVDDKNRRTFPIPEFTPHIVHVRIADEAIELIAALPLVNGEGAAVTGLSNLADHDEKPWDFSAQTELTFNQDGLDTEGIVRTSAGDFWLVDEYAPSIVHVDADGQVVRRFVPEGLVYDASTYEVVDSLPAILATRRGNRGFEGVALSPDETTLFAAVQSPLNNPDGDTGAASRNARIIAFDLATETVVGEYVYQFEESTVFGADVVPGDMKISGLIALDSDTLLVLERTDFVAHIYRVELAGAENILGSAWDDAATAPSLEASDMSGMTDGMMSKTMVIDLSTLAETPNKIEGMALVDDDTIAIANDNDFDIGDFGADGMNVGTGLVSQILVIDLAMALR
ncbi:MAG: esterase-like activity of phytase family protein [Chloroflexota bacterium]|nr:esterase-like activity of phytase family protein [Chloroflexota bacterium]